MSDAPPPLFFRRVPSGAKRRQTAVCALLFDLKEALPVATTRLTWSGLMGSRFRELARAALGTGKPEGKSLPYTSLRAAIQVQLPDCVMLSRDLGRPWSREDGGAFIYVAEGTAGDCGQRLCGVLRTWAAMVLRPWAKRLDIDEALVDSIDDGCTPMQALTVDHGEADLLRPLATAQDFDRLRHPVLQEVSRRLEGLELFPGLGPVYRIVRSRSSGNEVTFQTWPAMAKSGGLYSMVATLGLETLPYLGRPFLTVRASRRRWLTDMPSPAKLRRQRTLTGYLMGRAASGALGGPLAVELLLPVRSGVPEEPSSPQYLHQALAVRSELARPLAEMVQARGQDVFLGIPYSPQRDGKAPVGAGASTRDQLDLLDAVEAALKPMGMQPMPFEEAATRRIPKRALDYHKALEAEGLVAEFAVALGSNELSPEDLVETARMLMDGAEPPDIAPATAEKGRRILEKLQDANWQRIRRAFGETVPTIVLIARRESERTLMRAVINGLFGPRLTVAERQLPRDVHGPRVTLPGADGKAAARFAARVEAWGALAADLAGSFEGCHGLVQADEWYDRKHDDEVNKPAGRYVLAMAGNANVQYLLPAEPGWRGLARYLHRIQSAVYDLMFGHSALVSEVHSLVDADFTDPATRPRAIIGVSLVTQARLRNGGQGGQVCLASRIDVRTGRTTARVGWFDQAMQWTPGWVPFFDAMKHIAGLEGVALGPTIDVQRRSFQSFVAEVVDAAVADGDRPVVLVDSTSAAGLWPWLADAKIDGPPVLGPEDIDKSQEWSAARLVRIRRGRAGRVLERTTVSYERYHTESETFEGQTHRYCPTAIAKTVELSRVTPGPARHYWVTSGYLEQRPRGLSVYRTFSTFVPAQGVSGIAVPTPPDGSKLFNALAMDISDEPYRLPNALDVTVAFMPPGDDPANIAHLVASLRCGYGHSRLDTTLPAPLFFETKARDYMARFTIDELDADDDEAASPVLDAPPEAEAEEEDAALSEDELLEAAAAETAVEAVQPMAAENGVSAVVVPSSEPSSPLTLLPPWSRLLRRSLAVSLIDSTWLSTEALPGVGLAHGALRFGIPGPSSRLSAVAVDEKTDVRAAAAVSGMETILRDDEDGGACAGDDVGDDDILSSKDAAWLAEARAASIPVPSFADTTWLSGVTSLPTNNLLLRSMHRHRNAIEAVSGYKWPEQRPHGPEAANAILRGLHRPLGFRAITDVAYLSIEKNKRRKFHPFGILYNRLQPWRWAEDHGVKGGRGRGVPRTRSHARSAEEIIRLLAEEGLRQDALSLAYLDTLCRGWKKPIADAVVAKSLGELDAFMDAIAQFTWWEGSKNKVFIAVWRAIYHKAPTGNDLPRTDDEPGLADEDAEEDTGSASGSGENEYRDEKVLNFDSDGDEVQHRSAEPEGAEMSAGWQGAGLDQNEGAAGVDAVPEVQADMEEAGVGSGAVSLHGLAQSAHGRGSTTEIGDPAAAALAAWRDAMTLLTRAATAAHSGEPDANLLRAVMVPVRKARSALGAWLATQPKLVDAASLVARGQAVIEALASLPKPPDFCAPAELGGLSGAVMVEPRVFDEAASLIAEAEASIVAAKEAQGRFIAIMADQARIFERRLEMNAAMDETASAMQTAVSRVDAAGAILTANVQAAPTGKVDTVPTVSPKAEPFATEFQGMNRAAIPAETLPEEISPSGAAAGTTLPLHTEASSAAMDPVQEAPVQHIIDDGLDKLPDNPLDDPDFEDVEQAETDDVAREPDGYPEPTVTVPGETASTPASVADANGAEPVAHPAEATRVQPDPILDAVSNRLTTLVTAHAFGEAYQLRRAAEAVFPALDNSSFTTGELRLAAMTGHIGHVAMQASPLLERVVQAAVSAVTERMDNSETMMARRIILSAVCAEIGMFHSTLPAPTGMGAIDDTTPELAEAFRDLKAAVADGWRFGFVTPALLRTVGEQMADDRSVESCRQAVLDNIVLFSKMHFNWAPANRVRAHLHMRNGVLGEYRAAIEAGDTEAARAFIGQFRSRNAVMDLAEKIDASLTVKPKPLDGAARERLLSAFEDLSALSAEYVDTFDALNAARISRHKGAVQRIAQSVSAGADTAIRALDAFAAEAGPLLAAACAFAIRALTRLRDAALGRFATVGIHDHQLATHGPLLWLPNMHYGSSWLPSPYRPEGIINAFLDAPVPASGAPGEDAFREAVRARVKEGSFIAARMLIEASAFYGIDEGTRALMADHCDANLASWRSALKDELDATRRMIDKVQRMGSLVRIDQASAFAVLDRITPDTLPAEVSLEARTEEIEPEQILDFGSARDQIQDVRDRVSGLLEPLRRSLLERLERMAETAGKADIERVRELIETHDDLVTAGEYVEFLEDGGGLPERAGGNRRFHTFFPAVPEALAKLGKSSLDDVKRAIETGTDLPGLPYSHVPAASRAERLDQIEVWRNLRRRVEQGGHPEAVQTQLTLLFNGFRTAPELLSSASNGPKLPPKTYVTDMRLSVFEDKASLLLPDFGSLMNFSYRIAVAPRLPSEAEMVELCRDAGTFGTMVVVTSLIDAERRRQLQGICLAQSRRVLVLDEAILFYALSEAEFRPLTLIECAQPFSFAAPYKDYGNAPVPPEMFFGRETEIRKIVDRMGSCIVYGGRRLGKTALLRHIRAQYADAGAGGSTAVGYANIRDVGAVQNRIWDVASRDLPAIFPTSVKTAVEFSTRIEKWLEEDNKRRVLLLLDEADQFIEGDSKQQFTEFSALQRLMDNSSRRFKVVLAGLHNVTRIVRTENSPLKQIASDPQRIGPLMDRELPDAERLVTRPLSALGYEFKNRSDVWRILSHCNYYPVLVQTFCAGLLASLTEATIRRPRGAGEITDRQVRDAIENEGIRKEIEEKFAYTIREIDPRYELITCIVAEKVTRDTEGGRADEGMTAVEVLDGAAAWWPVAFEHPNALETIKDLLDEMVGLGVLRQTPTGSWALRSHAILRLLGDNDHVATVLISFAKRPPPRAFDPRSMRRSLALKDEPNYPCPLTWGQEHDLVSGQTPVSVVFGSTLADVNHVGEALRGTDAVGADGARTAVLFRNFSDSPSFHETLRAVTRAASPTLLVVDMRSQWDFGWIEAALKQKGVKDHIVRLVFVGGAEHALRWALNPKAARLPGVQVITLQPWADAYLDHRLGDGNLPPERFAQDIRRITGGYNRLMSWAVTGPLNHERFAKHLERTEQRIAKSPELLAEAGLSPPLVEVFGRIAEWADASGRVRTEEIGEAAGEASGSLRLSAAQVIQFGTVMGVLEPLAARPGEEPDQRTYAITPVVLAALRQRQRQLEVA